MKNLFNNINDMYINKFGPVILHKDCKRGGFWTVNKESYLRTLIDLKENVLRYHSICGLCGATVNENNLVYGSVKMIEEKYKEKFLFFKITKNRLKYVYGSDEENKKENEISEIQTSKLNKIE